MLDGDMSFDGFLASILGVAERALEFFSSFTLGDKIDNSVGHRNLREFVCSLNRRIFGPYCSKV